MTTLKDVYIAPVTVHRAWSAVMGDVQGIRKADRNQQQNFNFRGIDSVLNAVGPALRTHGVSVIPVDVASRTRDVVVGKNATPMREVTVTVTWRVYGPAGDHFDGMSLGEAMDAGDKATPKAMSVALRTFLLQSLTIPTDEPDPDTSTYERAHPPTGLPVVDGLEAVLAELSELVHGFGDVERDTMSRQRKLRGWPERLGAYSLEQAEEALGFARDLAAGEPFALEPDDAGPGAGDAAGWSPAELSMVTGAQIDAAAEALHMPVPSGSKSVRLDALVERSGLDRTELLRFVAERPTP